MNTAQRKVAQTAAESGEKLATMADQSEVIYTAQAVFPFDLFPDEIMIDRNKVIMIQRYFFWSSETRTVDINGILDVTVDTNPLFASMLITGNQVGQKPIRIRYLRIDEAKKIQRLIQGLSIAVKRKIDYTNVPTRDLMSFVEQLGSA